MGQRVRKVMVQPISLTLSYLQNRSQIRVWLYEQVNRRTQGCITGCDDCNCYYSIFCRNLQTAL
uniref:Uncharacterized protein n=1 Tax=Ursus maritimus TaxID=29073 RepID=A0A452TAW8_URSMA